MFGSLISLLFFFFFALMANSFFFFLYLFQDLFISIYLIGFVIIMAL